MMMFPDVWRSRLQSQGYTMPCDWFRRYGDLPYRGFAVKR
jgi:hypothetical protein